MTSTEATMPEGTEQDPQAGATPDPNADKNDQGKQADGKTPEADANKGGDEPLGEGGKKALEAEREARKDLERQIQAMRDGLAGVFGVKPDAKATTDDVLTALSNEVAQMKRDNDVLRLVNQHGITDENDIATLASITDPSVRASVATRLAPTGEPNPQMPPLAGGARQTPKQPAGSLGEAIANRYAAK